MRDTLSCWGCRQNRPEQDPGVGIDACGRYAAMVPFETKNRVPMTIAPMTRGCAI